MGLNDDHDAAFANTSNCITLHTDLLDMVEMFEIAYGTSQNWRRSSWMWTGENLEQYLPKTCEIIYMV